MKLVDYMKMTDEMTEGTPERALTDHEKGTLYAHSKLLAIDIRYASVFDAFFLYFVSASTHKDGTAIGDLMKFILDRGERFDPTMKMKILMTSAQYMTMDLGPEKVKSLLNKFKSKNEVDKEEELV